MDIILKAELDAPAEVAWQLVGEEFGDIATWTRTLTGSHLEGSLGAGAVRHCRFPPDMFSRTGALRERLDEFDRSKRELRYSAAHRARAPRSPAPRALRLAASAAPRR